jgi:sigma-54 dependent transcriptional regulator, acetoin dehydrogenase operon transcriptional activator AcoR
LRQDHESFGPEDEPLRGPLRPLALKNTDGMRGSIWAVTDPLGDNMLSMPNRVQPAQGIYALESDSHRSLIGESHGRSQSFGLHAADKPDYSALRARDIHALQEENRLLYQHASPVMETLYEQIANTHSMVLLTSNNGLILHSLGDADFLEKASQVALMPGVDWSEQSKGTNAIGTALTEAKPVVVHGHDHFLNANQFLTCSCTPIFDPYGKVMGALDVTGDERSYHQHTMALVRMSAQMIENHMFANVFPDAMRIHFHTRPEFLNTLVEGIIVFTLDGRFLSANRSAQFQLGLSVNAMQAHTFSSLFNQPMSQFHDRLRHAAGQAVSLCMHNGVSVFCQARLKPVNWYPGHWLPTESEKPQTAPVRPATTATTAAAAGRASLSSLHYLNTGDPQVAAVLHKLQRVQGNDIPIMILGETGTGKDILAQAIHNDSARSRKPFVSINCASIPETLIESELFGYEEGAFTGAKRRGAPGKIQMAHGGTLFLDEIGDMPTQLQARLLRVLQERRVTPLGSGKEYEVDVMLICATNKNLKTLIAQNQFREDLYYRLNGLVVRLPGLRERSDFEVVANKILLNLCSPDQKIRISPEVMALFLQYRWPGNFRQLHNLLRTAVAMVGHSGDILVEHLPDDFLEEVQEHISQSVTPQPLPCESEALGMPHSPSAPLPVMAQAPASPAAWTAPVSAPAPIETPTPPSMGAPRLQDVALQAMADALRQCQGNVSAAAKLLGVSRNTIYRKKEQLPADVWG